MDVAQKNYTETTGCAAEVRQCKFPFTFNDKEYTNCTNDLLFPSDSGDRTKESFKWCATSTNSDGKMKKGKWGRCDEATCKWENPASPTPNSHHLNCLKHKFDLTIKVTPKTATLKLNGESRKLNNGQHTEKVAQGAKLVIEMDHHDYEKEEHTIQMGDRDMVEEYELVSCQKLQNCKPNWSAWGPWKECVPRCYNDYSKRKLSTKERTRYYLPNADYLQDDWKGDEKESRRCSSVPRCPWDKLKTIVVKNSDRSYNSDDWLSVRVTNAVSSCVTGLDTCYDDFKSGSLDTFTNLNTEYVYDSTYWKYWSNDGYCQDFNITSLKSLELFRTQDKRAENYCNYWVADYILLKSDTNVMYKCTNHHWIPADKKWHKFDCKLYPSTGNSGGVWCWWYGCYTEK